MRNAIGQLNIRIDDELNSAFIEKSRKNNTSATPIINQVHKAVSSDSSQG